MKYVGNDSILYYTALTNLNVDFASYSSVLTLYAKNSPIYPFFLGEAPELFVFVLVLSVSRYGGGSKCPDFFLFTIANFEPLSPQKR